MFICTNQVPGYMLAVQVSETQDVTKLYMTDESFQPVQKFCLKNVPPPWIHLIISYLLHRGTVTNRKVSEKWCAYTISTSPNNPGLVHSMQSEHFITVQVLWHIPLLPKEFRFDSNLKSMFNKLTMYWLSWLAFTGLEPPSRRPSSANCFGMEQRYQGTEFQMTR